MGSISGSIKFDGLGSGMQYADLIAAMKQQQEMPKTRLEYWKADWQKRYDAFDEILNSITKLNTSIKDFSTIGKIMSKVTSSSNASVAKAVAKAEAAASTHSLEVNQLATNAVLTNSTVYSSKNAGVAPYADAIFSYTYKGKSQDVRIPKGQSIQGMVDQINKDAKANKVDVTATLVKTGSGYIFQLSGNDTGAGSDLSINSKTSVANFTPKTMQSSVTFAKNSSFMGNMFGPDGLKFSYGTVPDPLPPGKTPADYITDFHVKPNIDNSWQSNSRYADKNAALGGPINFEHNGKTYNFPADNEKAYRTGTAYGTNEPITGRVAFTYNGKDYSIEPDGTKTLSDVKREIDAISDGEVSVSMVPEMGADNKPTGKSFLQATGNKVGLPVHDEPPTYASATEPITSPISFTTPNGTTLTYAPDGTRNLQEVMTAINGDPTAGVEASLVTDEVTGKVGLKVVNRDYPPDGMQLHTGGGGAHPPNTIGDVMNSINAGSTTSGLSAGLVETENGYALRLSGRDGDIFSGGAQFGASQRTMQEVVTEINNQGASKGVFASLYKNADGTVSLELRGNDPTGISFPDPDMAAKFNSRGPSVDAWNKRAAQDARFHVDGLETEFTSSTNELTDVIPGLTVTLLDVGKTTLTTSNDTSKVEENVMKLVEGINELLTKFDELTKFDKNKEVQDAVKETKTGNSWERAFASSQLALQKGGTLTGNYGVTLLESQLKTLISGTGVGFRVPQTKDDIIDTFHSLQSIGIIMDSDESSPTFGRLTLREPKTDSEGNPLKGDGNFRTLSQALEEDPLAVAQLLAGSGGVSDMSGVNFDNQLDGVTKPGTYDVKYSVSASGTLSDVYIGGVRAQRVDAANNSYALLDGPGKGMTISITDLTPGDYSGTVRIKQGKVSQLTEFLDYQSRNDPTNLGSSAKRGTLQVLKENYKDIMDNIDKKIEQEERRLTVWEKRMNLKYSRLDTLLGTYNMKSQQAQAALSGMPAIE